MRGLGLGLGRSSARTYSPLSLPSLALWLPGDSYNGSTWKDLSGNGNDYAGGVSPGAGTWSNGRPVPSFNGTQYLTRASSPLGRTNLTLWLVVQYASATPGNYQFAYGWQDNAGTGVEVGASPSNFRALSMPNVGVMTDGALTTNAEIWEVVNNAGTWSMTMNGGSQTLTNPTSAANAGSAVSQVGARAGGTLFMHGLIAEIVGCNAVVNSSLRAQQRAYLGSKWSITTQ